MKIGASRRETYIDAVKGFTITLVVLHHVISGIKSSIGYPDWFMEMYQLTVPIRMPLFFMVAGFFVMKSMKKPFRDFLNSKLLHFLYFYLLWNTIDVITRASLSKFTNNNVELSKLLEFLWNPSFTLWFLYSLFWIFLVSYLLVKLRIKPLVQIFVTLIISLVIQYTIYYDLPFFIRNTIKFFPFFLIGMNYSKIIRYRLANPQLRYLVISGCVFITLAYCKLHGYFSDLSPMLFYLSAVSASIFYLVFFKTLENTFFNYIFKFVGERSLYIYLMHFIPAAGYRVVFQKLGLGDNLVFLTIVCTLLSVITCIAVYEMLRKFSFSRPLFNRPPWFRLNLK